MNDMLREGKTGTLEVRTSEQLVTGVGSPEISDT